MTRVEIAYPGSTIYSCQTEVRITDLSAAMHLGFDSLVGIVNDASAKFFDHIGVSRSTFSEVNTIYADLSVVYRSEAFHGDRLSIDVAATEATDKRLDLTFRVAHSDGGQEVALARIGVLFFDYAGRKVVEIPDAVRHRVRAAEPGGE